MLRVGPKDAQIDLAHCSLADLRYYRNALRGLVVAVVERFSDKAYVQERSARRAPGTTSLHAQWT